MGRRVFFAEPVQPGDQSPHSIDFGPSMVLAGEKVPSDNSVSVTIREREAPFKNVTAELLFPGSVVVSNNVATFQRAAAGSDNRDYVATLVAVTTQNRPEEADLVIPVRSRPKTFTAP